MASDAPDVDGSIAKESKERSLASRLTPRSWKVFTVAALLGLIIGGVAAWATTNLGIAPLAFLVGWIGGTWFLNKKRLPSESIGSGLYITALLLILTPVLFYVPIVLGEGSGEGAEAAGAFVGGILGLVVWGFVFFLLAIVIAAVGYFFKRRASKKIGQE